MKHLSKKIAISLLATSVTFSSTSGAGTLIDPGVVLDGNTTAQLNNQWIRAEGLDEATSLFLQRTLATQTENRRLKTERDSLMSKISRLEFQNIVLNAQQQKYRTEEHSTWQRFKNWVGKLDVTKITTTIISSLLTIIGTVLIALL